MTLDSPISDLQGVGDKLGGYLAKLGIRRVRDLLWHFPRRWEDYSQIVPIGQMRPGPVTFRGEIEQIHVRPAHTNRRLRLTEAVIGDDTGSIGVTWFNQPYLTKTYPPGSQVLVSGQVELKSNRLGMTSPAIEAASDDPKDTARIVPVYPETEGITSKQLRGLVRQVLDLAADLEDPMSDEILLKTKLIDLPEAIRQIHFPDNQPGLLAAKMRLAFDELWYLILAGLVIKQEIQTESAPVIKFDEAIAKNFVGQLGFKLTNAQRAAAWQILQDMERDVPMNRLLEGDVGSGKTVVAIMAATMAAAAGFQTALMVPTEVLARQHAKKIADLLTKLGMKSATILGKQSADEKNAALELAANGSADVVIGTHALISEKVDFKNLGLVVIDEQHRFGVAQRQELKRKATKMPHLLSMTATPIPRSLALTVYGDLDLTVIDELPPGRQTIITKVARRAERDGVYAEIDGQIEQGRQVYVICPLIEESEKLDYKSVEQESERLKKTVFSHRRIAPLHGRLKSEEKDAVMSEFAAGKIDILVSTTVIEVGIDVANATVMLIEGADRFGLATLHQLRGRVGRGAHQSFCYLTYENYTPTAAERLKAMEKYHDGFKLAQIDLEIRGPGQIYGHAQHGLLDLQLADISDTKLLAQVKELAAEFLQNPNVLLEYPAMFERVNQLKAVTSLD